MGAPHAEHPSRSYDPPLARWEKWALVGVVLLAIGFGVLVEIRSAFQNNRRTDLGCYLRSGWAVRSGANIYDVTDDNGWHYAYPPAFAVLMVPFADAPRGEARTLMLPYSLTVAIWYLFSVVITFLAVHWIATAIEEQSSNPPRCGGQRWWFARMLPNYICLAPIGCTYSRGQVNLLLILLIAGMYLAWQHGRRFCSGLWLAAAICLKLFPALLLIVPVWRRDGRTLAGVAAGLLVGIGVIPSLAWGIPGAIEVHRKFVDAIIKPGLGLGGERTRAMELMHITATDNQSIQAVLHSYQHWERSTRPPQVDGTTKLAHVLTAIALTAILLFAYGRHRGTAPIRDLMFVAGLIQIMTIASPVSHTHYFCLGLPAVMALAARSQANSRRHSVPAGPTLTLLMVVGILFTLPMIPVWDHRREAGLSLYGCLILWAALVVELWRDRRPAAVALTLGAPQPLARAA